MTLGDARLCLASCAFSGGNPCCSSSGDDNKEEGEAAQEIECNALLGFIQTQGASCAIRLRRALRIRFVILQYPFKGDTLLCHGIRSWGHGYAPVDIWQPNTLNLLQGKHWKQRSSG